MTPMTWNETVDLLALASVFDQRTVGEEDVKGWQLIADLERWTFPAARRVLVEHYRAGAARPRLTPAAVTDGIRAARRQAADSFRVPDVPDELPAADYPEWYRAELAAHVDTQLDRWAGGAQLPRAAVEPGGPLPIGAAPAELRRQIKRDFDRIGAPPRPGRPTALPHGAALDPRRRVAARVELDAARPGPSADEPAAP